MKVFNEILNEYGIFGYESISKQILTSLVSKEPILFVGEHGTGKTNLAEKLALALGYNIKGENQEFIAYDASKSLFEDVIGFPNPLSLQSGKLEYMSSPIAIWDKKFILIDELSRATPSMQNKWFEIIRSKRVMGQAIEGLEYVFAAMNPVEYLGANEIDSALADRFFQIVHVPSNFKDAELLKIINHQENKTQKSSLSLTNLIAAIRNSREKLSSEQSKLISDFIIDFSRKVHELGFFYSARRAAMLKESLSLYFAMDICDNSLTQQSMLANFKLGILSSWNYLIAGEEQNLEILQRAFEYATRDIKGEKSRTDDIINHYRNSNRQTEGKEDFEASNTANSQNDEDGDLKTFGNIAFAGLELFTVGFYEMVIKKNKNWKSNLEINN